MNWGQLLRPLDHRRIAPADGAHVGLSDRQRWLVGWRAERASERASELAMSNRPVLAY
jgi:hypothetical protein